MRLFLARATIAVVVATTICGIATRADAARGGTSRPFNLSGTVAATYGPDCSAVGSPTCTVTATGTMHSTHLGNTTVVETAVAHLDQLVSVDPLCFHADAGLHVTAPNGDTIELASTGFACPIVGTFAGTYAVVNGTGRFTDATGTGIDKASTPDSQHLIEQRTGIISY
jgi:hypothetical protein